MSMLAERRRKTKWTNIGRQALWKRDSSDATFGREMMEKMGWKVGQGLGANEQGIKEPLRICFKDDNKGVGFKDNDDEWIQQQSEFDEFLSKLSSEKKDLSKDSQTNTVQSLEERSRLSKARVHYHKFTRGKDLAKYSKKDLECIIGRNEKESSQIPGKMENQNGNIGNEDKSLIIAGSMVDYFAKKMQSKKRKIEDSLNIMDHEIEESSLGSRSKDKPEEHVVESAMEFDEKRKKKSKKKKEKDEGGCGEAPCDEMDIDNRDYKMKSSSEEGKKSKKTKIVQEHDQSDLMDGSRGCENETAGTESVGIPEEKEKIENVEESTTEFDEKRRKKSKKKKERDEGGCSEVPCDEMDIDNRDYKMKSSSEEGKKSKKTKIVQEHDQSDLMDGSRGCENETAGTESVGIPEEEENVNGTNLEGDEVLDEKLKKKKKKRKKEENPVERFDTENVEALNVLQNKDEWEGTQEKAESLVSAEKVRKKEKTSKLDRRVIIDEDDEGALKEKIKRKKKCLEAENRFNYEDCGTNGNDLNHVSHTETNFKKEKENSETKCESAVGNKQETRKDERERIVGEDPLYYKRELLRKENSLKGTNRNKLLNLIYSTNIEQFSGSNLGRLSGYGILSHR